MLTNSNIAGVTSTLSIYHSSVSSIVAVIEIRALTHFLHGGQINGSVNPSIEAIMLFRALPIENVTFGIHCGKKMRFGE